MLSEQAFLWPVEMNAGAHVLGLLSLRHIAFAFARFHFILLSEAPFKNIVDLKVPKWLRIYVSNCNMTKIF